MLIIVTQYSKWRQRLSLGEVVLYFDILKAFKVNSKFTFERGDRSIFLTPKLNLSFKNTGKQSKTKGYLAHNPISGQHVVTRKPQCTTASLAVFQG